MRAPDPSLPTAGAGAPPAHAPEPQPSRSGSANAPARGRRPPRLVVVNQFVPPALPPTARLAGELAGAARSMGWDVVLLGRDRGYGAAAVGGLRRYLRDLAAHVRLGWGLLWVRRPTLLVCLSDPPCLPVNVVVMGWLRRVPVVHWAMDVYPETAVALGQLPRGRLSRLLAAAMARACRGCRLCVALDEDMAGHLRRAAGDETRVEVLAPWPPPVTGSRDHPPAPATDPDRAGPAGAERVWLYSGNLGRAHDWRTMLEAQAQLERREADEPAATPWRLVLQGGGASMAAAREWAGRHGLRRVEFRPYAAEHELLGSLLAADVLVATLEPALRGLLWPSKLALMALCERPVAWIGPVEGSIVDGLRERVETGVFAPGQATRLADWLGRLPGLAAHGPSADQIDTKVRVLRDKSLGKWRHWLAGG